MRSIRACFSIVGLQDGTRVDRVTNHKLVRAMECDCPGAPGGRDLESGRGAGRPGQEQWSEKDGLEEWLLVSLTVTCMGFLRIVPR